ncbi:MAG: histidine phosphatase family protein [Nocardioides sp.]|uniref:histidine phosphatase family protein n=1 Tax=Nocardioides sp. TaxID=35761 RepID=UPI003F03994C
MSRLLLVRHGQASFGAEDYDNLSELGTEQSRLLGAALARRGVVPTAVVTGGMRRHRQTADALLAGGGWDLPRSVDTGWDEFDHLQVLAVHGAPDDPDEAASKAGFQRWFEEATARWIGGGEDDAYDESFRTFTTRVEDALRRAVTSLHDAPRNSTVVVCTSGGPVAWAATTLLGGGADLWLRLNPTTVNSSHSTVVVGSRGTTLVSLNEHGHLPVDAITYR